MFKNSRYLLQIPIIIETLKFTEGLNALLNVRHYAKKSKGDDCRRALKDIPPDVDPKCPHPCERRKKKEGILHKIKLKVVEGGTNFGTPFRRLECWRKPVEKPKEKQIAKKEDECKPLALPAPKKAGLPVPDPRPGVQVSILGAETAVGQYIALLLKQCPCIKKLRLYEANTECSPCDRDLCNVVQDLQHIDTNCLVQMFSCGCFQLERCLQNTDIVLMLESGCLTVDMPLEKRFCYQAPIVKRYADVIATECPRAFVIVCATPIDCMVPLIAETLKETGWYDPRKLLGSMAVPEMRTSTLAARALCLEPRYTRVPCVGGTEGEALVPLFSKAVEYFQFSRLSATMMTETIREAATAVPKSETCCTRAPDLSEAHAVTGLVKKVAHAMLCQDIPRVSGYVETDSSHIISPARFIASTVELSGSGVVRHFGLPKMNDYETTLMNIALNNLDEKIKMAYDWYYNYSVCSEKLDAYQLHFLKPKQRYKAVNDCTYANID